MTSIRNAQPSTNTRRLRTHAQSHPCTNGIGVGGNCPCRNQQQWVEERRRCVHAYAHYMHSVVHDMCVVQTPLPSDHTHYVLTTEVDKSTYSAHMHVEAFIKHARAASRGQRNRYVAVESAWCVLDRCSAFARIVWQENTLGHIVRETSNAVCMRAHGRTDHQPREDGRIDTIYHLDTSHTHTQ